VRRDRDCHGGQDAKTLRADGVGDCCKSIEFSYAEGVPAEAGFVEEVGCCEADYWDSSAGCCGRGFYCETCMLGTRRCPGPRRADRIAEVGNSNCACRGSYKFPVPPQYTYHWPGMYSQQTITEYTSPWRFPPLESYEGGAAGISARSDGLVQLPPPPLEGPGNLDPVSGR
jgi:hypothetical protein